MQLWLSLLNVICAMPIAGDRKVPSITRKGKQTCHTCWNRRYSCPVTGRMLPASQQLPLAVFFSRACRGTASEKQGAAEESCLRHMATHLAAVNSTSAPAAQPSQSSPGTEQVLHFWGPRQPRLDYKGKCASDPLGGSEATALDENADCKPGQRSCCRKTPKSTKQVIDK